MPHLRKRIREAVKTLLTGLATTGTRVFEARKYPLQASELPGLCIYTNDESSGSVGGQAPMDLERHVELVVEGYAAASADVEDALDQIALEVEKAIASDHGLGGLAKHVTPTQTHVEFDVDAEKPHGLIRITFDAWYMAREDSPDVAA